MRMDMATLILVLSSVACSVPNKLDMPSFPNPPTNWKALKLSTIPGTSCPDLAGEYSEPPLIYRSGKKARYTPKDNIGMYSSYIPFHRGDRNELAGNEIGLTNNNFLIRQPDATQFYFLYLNELTNSLVEYHFTSTEGDFECHNGYIEFPNYSIYGMIEGRSVNFQIRNIVVKDESGALIIQSTRGPFRGKVAKATNEFTYEFFRYPKVDEVSKKDGNHRTHMDAPPQSRGF